ncbi:hypothetical protein J7T55_011563 [Diaporthe amygdali]|uniref:uncharacterized protein n=1 Tax=Phomopsis amygdali TaxID=1214568 RepID=UPI0022FE9283|nr:uncharacterized protein J7T55_011563 [Diaporthe amygdali]KAJ0123099.1 hypothetical protein J7T55_011563 [Diaporthe amygdali]
MDIILDIFETSCAIGSKVFTKTRASVRSRGQSRVFSRTWQSLKVEDMVSAFTFNVATEQYLYCRKGTPGSSSALSDLVILAAAAFATRIQTSNFIE